MNPTTQPTTTAGRGRGGKERDPACSKGSVVGAAVPGGEVHQEASRARLSKQAAFFSSSAIRNQLNGRAAQLTHRPSIHVTGSAEARHPDLYILRQVVEIGE
jgi:hypothetical protein